MPSRKPSIFSRCLDDDILEMSGTLNGHKTPAPTTERNEHSASFKHCQPSSDDVIVYCSLLPLFTKNCPSSVNLAGIKNGQLDKGWHSRVLL